MSLEKEKNSSVFSKRLILLVSGFIVTFFLVHLASPRSFSERIESYEYYKSWSFNLVIVLGFLFSSH